jgi:hypothetical protein
MWLWKHVVILVAGAALFVAGCGFSPEYIQGQLGQEALDGAGGSRCGPDSGPSQVALADIAAILKANCEKCHAGVNPEPRLVTQEEILVAVEDIKRTVQDGSMPPGGGMSAADKEAIAQWQVGGGASLALNGVVAYKGGIDVLVEQRCLACHDGSLKSSSPNLSSMSLVRQALDDVIREVEIDQTMPPSGALPADQISLFSQWKEGGQVIGETGSVRAPSSVTPDPTSSASAETVDSGVESSGAIGGSEGSSVCD